MLKSINFRRKHAKKLKESKSNWWNEEVSNDSKTQTPRVQSCTDMMYQYSLPKKNVVRFEVMNLSFDFIWCFIFVKNLTLKV